MRDILVHVTDHRSWNDGVRYAAALARPLAASLTGLYCVENAASGWTGGSETGAMAVVARPTRERVREAQAADGSFRAHVEGLGIGHGAWVVHDGDLVRGITQLGHWHDLVVLGNGPDAGCEGAVDVADIAMTTRLPCLLVPPGAEARAPRHIAVAWDASLHAVRALHAALPLLERAQRISVLMAAPGSAGPARPGLPAFDLHDYCRRHGLDIHCVPLRHAEEPAGAAIPHGAAALGADLLVMGGFGHSGQRDDRHGGVTRSILRHSAIPLLLRH